MKDFREMQVWNKGHKLAIEIYKLTAGFPREEIFGLFSYIVKAINQNSELRNLTI